MNKLYTRLSLIFLGFLYIINSAFAADNFLFTSLINFFGKDGVFKLLGNEYVVFVLIYIAMLVGFHNILKIVTNITFKNNKKEAGTIAFAISFIGTTGIFFMYGKTPAEAISVFGGGIGLFLISIILISVLVTIDRMMVSHNQRRFRSPGWFIIMGLALMMVNYILISMITKLESIGSFTMLTSFKDVISSFGGIATISLLIGVIMWISHRRTANNQRDNVFRERHPEVEQARVVVNTLNHDVTELERLGRELGGML